MRSETVKSFQSAFAALLLVLVSWPACAAGVTFATGPLTIVTTDGKSHDFTVELALDNDQRALGLMNRKAMADDHGMLFDFGQTRQVMMWMKNTILPLDMLFIARDGKVETIRENAVPFSEAIIDSNVPVAYVLELNAGTASRLKITPGAAITAPAIKLPASPAIP